MTEILAVLENIDTENFTGVFHCFNGTLEEAFKVIEMGFMLGIGGVVTFKNSGLDKIVSAIGIEHLMLETDAPFLTPVPFRGKRNESSYLLHIAQKIAEIKNMHIEDVARITTDNATKLFNVDLS